MKDEVVWDDEERDDVMSLDMTDRILVYQPSRERAPLPMCLQTCERMIGERKGKHTAAASTSDPTIQCVTFLHCGLPSMTSLPLPQCSYYACSHSLCLRAELVSLGPDVRQALLKACFGERAEADLHLLQHKDVSVGDLESSLQLLAGHDEKNAIDEQAQTRLIRVELRWVERGGRGQNSLRLIRPLK